MALCTFAQSCLTLCDPYDCSLPGSSVHVIFSRQEYWNRLSFPFPGDLPDPGIKPEFHASPALAGGFFTTDPPGIQNYISPIQNLELEEAQFLKFLPCKEMS